MRVLYGIAVLLLSVYGHAAHACGVDCNLECDRYCKTLFGSKICDTEPFNQCVQAEQACNRSSYSVKATCQANHNYWKAYDAVEQASKKGLVENREQCATRTHLESAFQELGIMQASELAALVSGDCGCYICETLFP